MSLRLRRGRPYAAADAAAYGLGIRLAILLGDAFAHPDGLTS